MESGSHSEAKNFSGVYSIVAERQEGVPRLIDHQIYFRAVGKDVRLHSPLEAIPSRCRVNFTFITKLALAHLILVLYYRSLKLL